jgi:hypothetical protein
LSFPWYQPWHENGNILSYPIYGPSFGTPADLGSFTLPDGTQKSEPMISPSLQSWGGTSGTIHLEYSDSSGKGSERTYSHTLAESADLKVAGSVSVSDFGTNGSFRASAEFEFHNSNSWGNVTTSSNTTNQTTDLTLNQQPAGNANQAYDYYPTIYMTTDGTVKVAHAVDNPANAQGSRAVFWSNFYGRGPDPALNLPGRFSTNGTDANGNQPWYPTTDLSRKLMRGFFLRKPDPNPVTGDYDYLATTPLLGDRVRIDARVYSQRGSGQVARTKEVSHG